jgi:membrane-associated phospholipid phosphatase
MTLPPTGTDLWLARRLARVASTPVEDGARALTWAADEKVMMAVVGLAWLRIRLLNDATEDRYRADHFALTVAVSAVLPHVAKHFIRRERPDRRVIGHPRHGVPRSGKPYDSFPSGHALHLGAAAAALSRYLSRRWRVVVWVIAGGIASTRLILLAHWLSDVVGAFVLGVGLESALYQIDHSACFERKLASAPSTISAEVKPPPARASW